MADRVPLQYPLYGATFGEAVGRYWRKYAVFTGRASRSEYWWAYLFACIVGFAVGIVVSIVFLVIFLGALLPTIARGRDEPPPVGPFITAFIVLYVVILATSIPFLIPNLSASVRRLHDAGFSGLWALLFLAPYGSIAVLVLCILDSNPDGARFDPPPPSPEPSPQPMTGSDPDASATIRS